MTDMTSAQRAAIHAIVRDCGVSEVLYRIAIELDPFAELHDSTPDEIHWAANALIALAEKMRIS